MPMKHSVRKGLVEILAEVACLLDWIYGREHLLDILTEDRSRCGSPALRRLSKFKAW